MDYDLTNAASRVRNFLDENFLFGEVSTLKDNDSFLDSGILDSTGVLQLITFLGDTYGVVVADEELTPDNLDSIDQIVAYLNRKLQGTAASNGHLRIEQTA